MPFLYKEIISSKTGSLIPVLKNGKTIESIYNPEKDAERKISALETNTGFFLILGLGSGILINQLIETFPEAKILCVEYSKEEIDFLSQSTLIQTLKNKINLITKDGIFNEILSSYLPALHGNMKILEQTNYFSGNKDYEDYVKGEIQKALKYISADFSVQSHFGKIWQHNILNNISEFGNRTIEPEALFNKEEKTSVVLAAGPTLNKEIEIIKKDPESFCVISTDTAYQAAKKNGIHCDYVVTLDAQNISVNHFTGTPSAKTIFLIDYNSSPSIVRKLSENKIPFYFFASGHPLIEFLNLYSGKKENLLHLESGNGTVTIAAVDFAIQAGFREIKVLGADFSYPCGKPYCKGSYLDTLYNMSSNRLKTSEQQFDRLMFRTELIRPEDTPTTEVLLSYKSSFEAFLQRKEMFFIKKQNVYEIKKKYENINKEFSKLYFDREYFLKAITSENKDLITASLPFLAFLQMRDSGLSRNDLIQKAISDIKRYTER